MKIGDKVRDTITGFEGVITGACEYITGCKQFLLQPRIKDDGDFVAGKWFDEDRCESVKKQVALVAVTNAGPDKPAPIK